MLIRRVLRDVNLVAATEDKKMVKGEDNDPTNIVYSIFIFNELCC
jgi:hypothetical protein